VFEESSIIFYEYGFADIHMTVDVEVELAGYPDLQFDGYISALMDEFDTSSCSITGFRTIVWDPEWGNYEEKQLINLNIDDCKVVSSNPEKNITLDSKTNWSVGDNKQFSVGIKGLFYQFMMTNLDIIYQDPVTSEIEILRINIEDGILTSNSPINNQPVVLQPNICETVVLRGNTLEESIAWDRLANCLADAEDLDGLYAVGLTISTYSVSSGDKRFTILCTESEEKLPSSLDEWLDEEILDKKSCKIDFSLSSSEVIGYNWDTITIDSIFCDMECYYANNDANDMSGYEFEKEEFVSINDGYMFNSEFNRNIVYLAMFLIGVVVVFYLGNRIRKKEVTNTPQLKNKANDEIKVGFDVETEKQDIPMAECGSCRAIIALDSKECPECGIRISGMSEEALGECGACDELIPLNSDSCPVCGVPLQETGNENEGSDDDDIDEIDIGSHIGLVLEDEEVFGTIIEFDDEEGLVTIKEAGTGDLVTGYQDGLFLED
jgi:RNA polymerase subunit RPABC4/transcription elongation factor Spt4